MGAEVIEVVERRRRWSTEDKLKVLLDGKHPVSTAGTIRRHRYCVRRRVLAPR